MLYAPLNLPARGEGRLAPERSRRAGRTGGGGVRGARPRAAAVRPARLGLLLLQMPLLLLLQLHDRGLELHKAVLSDLDVGGVSGGIRRVRAPTPLGGRGRGRLRGGTWRDLFAEALFFMTRSLRLRSLSSRASALIAGLRRVASRWALELALGFSFTPGASRGVVGAE